MALTISAKSRQGPKPPRKRFPSDPTSVKEIPMVYMVSQPSFSEGRCSCVSVWQQRNDNPSCLSHMIRGEGSLKARKCQELAKRKELQKVITRSSTNTPGVTSGLCICGSDPKHTMYCVPKLATGWHTCRTNSSAKTMKTRHWNFSAQKVDRNMT